MSETPQQPQTTWKPIEPQLWTYEKEGASIEGVLINKREGVGANKSRMYTLDVPEKGPIQIWGSTVLDQRMDCVKIGDHLRITYKGTEKSKRGQDCKIFKVEVAA